jgi:hypothetical protein
LAPPDDFSFGPPDGPGEKDRNRISKAWRKRLLRNIRFQNTPTNTVLRIRRKMKPIRNLKVARRKRIRRKIFTPILVQKNDFNQDFQLNWA